MTWEAWFTLGVAALTLICLAKDLLAPATVMIGAAIALLLGGIIKPEEAFAGFGNPAPVTVAALYVLARGAEKTGLLQPILQRLLGRGGGGRWTLTRLLVPCAMASAFLNNTPIVAMMIPQVLRWAERAQESVARYLMPLSFAVVLGGVITTIGTSTNLVVSGLLQKSGGAPLGLFEITPVGLPVAVVGLATLILTVPWLQPDRQVARKIGVRVREFAVSMTIVSGGPLDGKRVDEAGLRDEPQLLLLGIEREVEVSVASAAASRILQGGDQLNFVGGADAVVELQSRRGLVSTEDKHITGLDDAVFYQAVVGAHSPLRGKTLRDRDFRRRYQAAVIAIHRPGRPGQEKLSRARLKRGDTLLLLADPGFGDRWRERNDFSMIASMEGTPPAVAKKTWIVAAIGLFIVGVAGVGLLPILQASLIGAVALVATRVLTAAEARNAIDFDTIVVIAASFALGAAMEKSGLAAAGATLLTNAAGGASVQGTLLGLTLATVLTTELITNNAAAALLFPIAVASAHHLGVDPRPFAITVAVAASNSFLTPIGYQTNTMVYGPGGYRYLDYFRVGLPLTITTIIATVLVIPWVWRL